LSHGQVNILATEFNTHSECAKLVLNKTTNKVFHIKLKNPHKQSVLEAEKQCDSRLQSKGDENVCKIRVIIHGYN
jgi:hypothetical protein